MICNTSPSHTMQMDKTERKIGKTQHAGVYIAIYTQYMCSHAPCIIIMYVTIGLSECVQSKR